MTPGYVHCRVKIGDVVYAYNGPKRLFGEWISSVLTDVYATWRPFGDVRIEYFGVDPE